MPSARSTPAITTSQNVFMKAPLWAAHSGGVESISRRHLPDAVNMGHQLHIDGPAIAWQGAHGFGNSGGGPCRNIARAWRVPHAESVLIRADTRGPETAVPVRVEPCPGETSAARGSPHAVGA